LRLKKFHSTFEVLNGGLESNWAMLMIDGFDKISPRMAMGAVPLSSEVIMLFGGTQKLDYLETMGSATNIPHHKAAPQSNFRLINSLSQDNSSNFSDCYLFNERMMTVRTIDTSLEEGRKYDDACLRHRKVKNRLLVFYKRETDACKYDTFDLKRMKWLQQEEVDAQLLDNQDL